MTDQSPNSEQPTLFPIDSATSSPELVAGLSPFALPASPRTENSGPPASHASRFRRPGSAEVLKTSGTFGLLGENSSPSVGLQRYLESRLLRTMESLGSLVFDLTWRLLDMPSGPPICALLGSLPRKSDSGFIGWPTPTARDNKGHDAEGREGGASLCEVALLHGWPAPTAQDSIGSRNRTSSRKAGSEHHDGETLTDSAVLHGLPRDQWKAPTVPGAYLNPELSRWVMGYPEVWDKMSPGFADWSKVQEGIRRGDFGATATPSAPSSPPSSSARPKKQEHPSPMSNQGERRGEG